MRAKLVVSLPSHSSWLAAIVRQIVSTGTPVERLVQTSRAEEVGSPTGKSCAVGPCALFRLGPPKPVHDISLGGHADSRSVSLGLRGQPIYKDSVRFRDQVEDLTKHHLRKLRSVNPATTVIRLIDHDISRCSGSWPSSTRSSPLPTRSTRRMVCDLAKIVENSVRERWLSDVPWV
jgi:hypothetical protein